jgi:hypothetical protein
MEWLRHTLKSVLALERDALLDILLNDHSLPATKSNTSTPTLRLVKTSSSLRVPLLRAENLVKKVNYRD